MSINTGVLTYQVRPHSPEYSETLNSHVFIKHLFNPKVAPSETSTPTPQPGPATTVPLRKSLEEISKDIREIEDFITVTEDILKRERERDREFYERERQRRRIDSSSSRGRRSELASSSIPNNSNKENKSPAGSCSYSIYSVNSPVYKVRKQLRKCKSASPSSIKRSTSTATTSRLHSRKGRRISYVDAITPIIASNNVSETQDLVKRIVELQPDRADNVDEFRRHMNRVGYDEMTATHEYLSQDNSFDVAIDAVCQRGRSSDFKSSDEDNLEMVIVAGRRSDDDTAIEMHDFGIVEGRGHGADLTRAATVPSSASSAQSNAT